MGYLYRNFIPDDVQCSRYLQNKTHYLRQYGKMKRLVLKYEMTSFVPEYKKKRKRQNLVKKINSDGTFKKVLTLRCTTKRCQTYQLLRKTNTFLLIRI